MGEIRNYSKKITKFSLEVLKEKYEKTLIGVTKTKMDPETMTVILVGLSKDIDAFNRVIKIVSESED